MRCAACGEDAPDGSAFCNHCGAGLASQCPGCGAVSPPGSRFCSQCGIELGSPAGNVQRASPKEYTPKHVADEILRTRSVMEGERKQVTVLFVDVGGSMSLAEQSGAEKWHLILDGFFDILTDGVHRFGGTVNQYTGDGIMALFGAPIALEDHAQRACYAALHLSDKLRRYADQLRVKQGLNFSVRMGLNSGEVVVGKIGDDLRMDYTAQGHTVGIAQRMEALASGGSALISEHTARLVEEYFAVRSLGVSQIRGIEDPIEIFELQGPGRSRTRLDRSRARGLSSFVGRDSEMAILEDALRRARDGTGQVVAIVADAGTGKSRLCAEFLERCRGLRLPALEAHGVSHGKSVPFYPILQLVRAYFGIDRDDSAQATRDKIAGRLLQIDGNFRTSLPLIFDLLGVSGDTSERESIDLQARTARLHDVMRRVLHATAADDTRVILLEDLHWFDGGSAAFVDTLTESVPATRDLVIATFRPECHPAWLQRSYCRSISLQPLDRAAISELLQGELGSHDSVAALPEKIFELTRGNPFFTEEVIQSLIDSGRLVGKRGSYRLTASISALEIPDTVQSLLAARMDRLPEVQKQVLQAAAVIGKSFAHDLLARVVDLPGDQLAAALSRLTATEFLYEAKLYPDLEYAFKHPLTREVAERSQLQGHRARIHAAVAEVLETLAGAAADEKASEIARHWSEGGDSLRAAQWHARAADWCCLTDLREGLRHWIRVREIAPSIDDERERSRLDLAACTQILFRGWRGGLSSDQLAECFEDGQTLARAADDRVALARLTAAYGTFRGLAGGSYDDHVRYACEAVSIADEVGDRGLSVAVGSHYAFARMFQGRPQEVLSACDAILDLVGDDPQFGRKLMGYSPLTGMLFGRGVALSWAGRLEEARSQLELGLRIATEVGDRETMTWISQYWPYMAWLAGGPESGLQQAQRAFDLAEELGNGSSRVIAHASLGIAYTLEANYADAISVIEKALELIEELNTHRTFRPRALASLAEAQALSGNMDGACRNAEEAISQTGGGGVGAYAVYARLVLARAGLSEGAGTLIEKVPTCLQSAEDLVKAYDIACYRPHVLELRALLAKRSGDVQTFTRLATEASELYRQIGASGHEKRLAGLLGP